METLSKVINSSVLGAVLLKAFCSILPNKRYLLYLVSRGRQLRNVYKLQVKEKRR